MSETAYHKPQGYMRAKCHKLLLFAVLMLWTWPAMGQVVCGDRGKMIHHLNNKYQESRIGIGLAANGAVLELFAAGTGTWTLLVTGPDGSSCAVANGTGWEAYPQPKGSRS